MRGIAALFAFQEFLGRNGLGHEFTVKLGGPAWDSLFSEAQAVSGGCGWFHVEKVEALGASGALRIVGPLGYINVERE